MASMGGVVLAGIVFVVVWFVGGILFGLLDQLRGLGDSRLQEVFRTLLVPGAGGYFAMAAVGRWLPSASIRGVFFGFSGVIFILAGMFITFLISATRRVELTFWEGTLPLLVLACAILGAYSHAKEHL
jgi:hypothetical protein